VLQLTRGAFGSSIDVPSAPARHPRLSIKGDSGSLGSRSCSGVSRHMTKPLTGSGAPSFSLLTVHVLAVLEAVPPMTDELEPSAAVRADGRTAAWLRLGG
jgi:hypothetical protein